MKSAFKDGINNGFTIVEVLIVLAVSGAILLSAIILVNGRQNKTAFTAAINDVQSQITQTINDVTNGYYPNSNNFVCSNGTISVGNNGQGTNQGCIFLGRAMQFAVQGTSPQQVEIYTIMGKQLTAGGEEASSYNASGSKVPVINNNNTNPLSAASYTLENGLTVSKMYYCDSGGNCSHNLGAVAFLQSLGSYSGGQLVSGSQQLNLIPVKNVQLGYTIGSAVGDINGGLGLSSYADGFVTSSPRSVNICLASGGTNQSGLISIDNGDGQISVNLAIKDGTTC